mmetsp:Transcript_14098/g.52916  ORF Transcript_14098/g.52916 Transcript_14098/m.52916 type:complete len:122 (+) Transcript_14098:2124-2489(+)
MHERDLFRLSIRGIDPRRFCWLDEVQSSENDTVRRRSWHLKGGGEPILSMKNRKGTWGNTCMSFAAVMCRVGLVHVESYVNFHVGMREFAVFLQNLRVRVPDDIVFWQYDLQRGSRLTRKP